MPIRARKVFLVDAAMPILFLSEFAQRNMFEDENVGSTLRSPQALLYPSHNVVAAAAATGFGAFAMHSGEEHRMTGNTLTKPCGGFTLTPVMRRWSVLYVVWKLAKYVRVRSPMQLLCCW
jgi:hypothetical protein